jgi:hypothetical protein
MAYQDNNTTVNINTLFLQFYLDVQKEMTKTFASQDTSQFNLYVYFLRSCVTRKDVREKIDKSMLRKEKEMAEIGGFTENQKVFMKGFCVIEECMNYLDHTLNITKMDAAGMVDSTDTDILVQLDKLELYKLAACLKSEEARKDIEFRIMQGNIANINDLLKEVTEEDCIPLTPKQKAIVNSVESLPQDSLVSQVSDTDNIDEADG